MKQSKQVITWCGYRRKTLWSKHVAIFSRRTWTKNCFVYHNFVCWQGKQEGRNVFVHGKNTLWALGIGGPTHPLIIGHRGVFKRKGFVWISFISSNAKHPEGSLLCIVRILNRYSWQRQNGGLGKSTEIDYTPFIVAFFLNFLGCTAFSNMCLFIFT